MSGKQHAAFAHACLLDLSLERALLLPVQSRDIEKIETDAADGLSPVAPGIATVFLLSS